MKPIRDLLAGSAALANIEPPEASFNGWERFLAKCAASGVVSVRVDRDGKAVDAEGPLSYALLKRWRWLRDARQRGLSYAEAEAAFNGAIDRAREEEHKSADTYEHRRAASIREQTDQRKQRRGHRPQDGFQPETDAEVQAIFDRAGELGL